MFSKSIKINSGNIILIKIITGFVLLSAFCLSCNSAKKQSEEQPNILLIVADDLGWNDVGYHGSEIKTPAIDNLAESGVVLEQFYVSPTCSPTRASLLSGRQASRFGILGPIAGKSEQVLPIGTPTVASILKDAGYTTAITGKWHLGLRPKNGPHKYGFEYTYGYLHGQIDPYTHRYKYGDRTWHRNNEFVDEEGHATDLITNEAMQYIRNYRDKEKPFFLYVSYSVPHFPLNEEDKWAAPYRDTIDNHFRREYAAATAHMDDAIGQLVKTLEDEKLRENTLLVFISDNGAQENWLKVQDQYEGRYAPHDRLGDNQPLRDWKASLYEGAIRVPAIFNWPAKFKPTKIDQVTSVNDILPTLADFSAAKIPVQTEAEGLSLKKTLLDNAVLNERLLYWRTPRQFAVRDGDWKLVYSGELADGASELFNIADDPNEKNDLADENKDIVQRLFDELKIQAGQDSLTSASAYE